MYVLIWVAIFTMSPKVYDGVFDVFPQTGASRFIATQLTNCSLIVSGGLLTLAYNAACYFGYSRIAATYDDVVLLNTFDLGDQLLGLLSWLLFAFVFSAFISLLVALMDKYRIRVLISMTAFVAMIITLTILGILGEFSLPDFSGRVEMPSPVDALIWVAIWMLLALGAFLMARRASRDDARARGGAMMSLWKVIVLFLLIFQLGFLATYVFPNADVASIIIYEQESKEAKWGNETIMLDATDIPADSDTDLSVDGIRYNEYGVSDVYDVERESDSESFTLLLNSSDSLTHFGGKHIKIKVHYPRHTINGYDIAARMNQRLDAWIDGTTLRVKYRYDKPKKMAAIPGWSFLNHTAFYGSSGYVDISVVDDAGSKS
jgi:hypothetical protein